MHSFQFIRLPGRCFCLLMMVIFSLLFWAPSFGQSHYTVTDLGTLGGTRSLARAINDAAQVVGYVWWSDNNYHAFLWQNGIMTDLGTFSGTVSEAYGINDQAQVVGGFAFPNGDG